MSVEIARPKESESDIQDSGFDEIGDAKCHNHNGESPDRFELRTLQLAHKIVEMFPEFKRKHRKFIGTVEVVSTAAIVIASAVVAKRLLTSGSGASDREVLDGLKEDDLKNMPLVPNKPIINGKNLRH